jgi:hypothetical protein
MQYVQVFEQIVFKLRLKKKKKCMIDVQNNDGSFMGF